MLNDRRKNVIQLTDKGWRGIKIMHEKFLELDKELNKGISANEQEICMFVLSKIQNKCN